MSRTALLVIALIVLAALASVILFTMPKGAAAPVEEAAVEAAPRYINETHGFSAAYPETLSVLAYTPDMATVGTPIEGGIEGVADLRVFVITGEPGESFTDAATRELANLCAADGPTGSFSCTGVDRILPFLTDGGTAGFEIYLAGELTQFPENTKTVVRKGPYYAFVMDASATATKVLVVHAPLNQSAEEADAEAIRAIARSVEFN